MKLDFTRVTPPIGTTRLRRRFAWLPVFIKTECIWLERYEVLQAFVDEIYMVKIDNEPKQFVVANWKTISKRTIS